MARLMDIKFDTPPNHKFEFTRNWFRNRNLQSFREYVHPEWAGKPVFYLEIGVFEGMSMTWMMQHILTHPQSRAVGIDPWLETTKLDGVRMEKTMARAFHNTTPWEGRCKLYRANSVETLSAALGKGGRHGIKRDSVDISMVDGCHTSLGFLQDAKLVLSVLKSGGWMLIDDVENDREKKDHVKQGLEMFLNDHGNEVKFLWKHKYMECYQKL